MEQFCRRLPKAVNRKDPRNPLGKFAGRRPLGFSTRAWNKFRVWNVQMSVLLTGRPPEAHSPNWPQLLRLGPFLLERSITTRGRFQASGRHPPRSARPEVAAPACASLHWGRLCKRKRPPNWGRLQPLSLRDDGGNPSGARSRSPYEVHRAQVPTGACEQIPIAWRPCSQGLAFLVPIAFRRAEHNGLGGKRCLFGIGLLAQSGPG
jgi:hypothetical protein